MNDKLTEGFRNIRKQGYFARQNFMCCQTCGCYAVPADKSETYVFYHAQDASALRESQVEHARGRCAPSDVGVFLAWAGDATVIRKAFEDAGLAVDHNGKDHTRIWVGMAPQCAFEKALGY